MASSPQTESERIHPTVVLCILDGVGLGRKDASDAVHLAHTPHLDRLFNEKPWVQLKAHGKAVGMPSDGDMGNSEVGHNAMGAGRVFPQGSSLVQDAIANGSLFESPVWQEIVSAPVVHFLGLLSDGNVHAHVDHLRSLISAAVNAGVSTIRVHALTDGRDVAPRSALTHIQPLEEWFNSLPCDCQFASGGGRMHITMDRYQADWEMVARGFRCHVHGEGRRFPSASTAIEAFYREDPSRDDQWLPAFVVGDFTGMQHGDAVVLTNFRGDRAVEISQALDCPQFSNFSREPMPELFFVGMMEYDGDRQIPTRTLVAPPSITDTVGQRMADAGIRVLSISETQKFGHVTFFFNGNKSTALPHEDQTEIPSDNLPFDQAPAMQAHAITQGVCAAMEAGKHDHIRLNIANGDMVGHTGNITATISAMEVVDTCVGELVASAKRTGSILLITADHGNAEEMVQLDRKTGTVKLDDFGKPIPSTSHSLNPIPFILIDPTQKWVLNAETGSLSGGIAQIGATLLQLCGLKVPETYLPSLVRHQ